MSKLDLVSLLEVAYQVESSSWFEDVLGAARPSFDRGLGLCAFEYDASRPSKLEIGQITELGVPEPVTKSGIGQAIISNVDASFVNKTYRSKLCATASEEPIFHEGESKRFLRSIGIGDVLVLNALDPSGKGFVMATYLPKMKTLDTPARASLSRVAAHFGAAYRLRRRLLSRGSGLGKRDALFTRDGELAHAESELDPVTMRKAVSAFSRAKKERSVEAWSVLADRRWSLLDRFESGGEEYIIARRNDGSVLGNETLTRRERQVLSYVALGYENKLIAYTLGVSHATVRVLVARASRKLSAKSREDLIEKFRTSSG
jgi:DNA-binding CsgD family transcriptional regulator